ncbi:PREDICTED: uncharacterized protein LOC100641450 isoform X1 [Amphimedon queenslandica]|uniref:Protein kinase domain-containing protein n=2 Tax=Amphimedon queenslandica TaxID=400682 RepID=A0AAN0K575_AMPQE|nr:PREDICTED: uncharacterized protein LOC100641450 isoform X1 [Amphimedon queenslandica]|eukprot:XP_019864502.1 PREDICTED: uncharacterized protein LOC100641450 isoform X1 [Amphimedon queenslandica]
MDLEGCLVGGVYEVKRRLQSGYFGVTWLAENKTTNRDVCLKTFFNESQSQRKELVILKQLCEGHFEHDYICRVLDVCIDRSPVLNGSGVVLGRIQFVVFEYCSGSDLFNFLCSGPWEKHRKVSNFSEPLARHYFKQVLLGVMYLHERGMYHRDIKPENCVLDDNLNLKLTDFGTNKYFADADPMKLIRTKTRGVGTETYRAPEVNSGLDYDPAAADVWSLGVTLFFFVGVEQMFAKVQTLDSYSKQIIAPLGIYFPFPLHCSKLDSYLRRSVYCTCNGSCTYNDTWYINKWCLFLRVQLFVYIREADLRGRGVNGSLKGSALPNESFWSEWECLKVSISPGLRDLLNRIFVLDAGLRITLRDILRHPWVTMEDGMSPDIIKMEMENRCPSAIRMSRDASPLLVGSKLLGGVDRVVLRESLSGANKEDIAFPEDSEIWQWSLQIEHLESLQLRISGGDAQEVMMDLNITLELVRNVLKEPANERHRQVMVDHISNEWIAQLFLIVGFLPKDNSLVLLDEYLDLNLLNCAVSYLQGIELAVTRAAIYTQCTDDGNSEGFEEDMEMEAGVMPLEEEEEEEITTFRDSVTLRGESVTEYDTSSSQSFFNNPISTTATASGSDPLTIPISMHQFYNRSISSNEDNMSQETAIASSQESMWAPGSVSTQSSQDDLPDGYQLVHEWNVDFSPWHRLIELSSTLQIHEPKQYRAAAEFCKMSGLLCSYGLYQVVCHDQLAMYCRGNIASFSMRIVNQIVDGLCKVFISTWCMCGNDEWALVLERLSKDMQ